MVKTTFFEILYIPFLCLCLPKAFKIFSKFFHFLDFFLNHGNPILLEQWATRKFKKKILKNCKKKFFIVIFLLFFKAFSDFSWGLHSPFYFLIGQNLFLTTKIPIIWLLVYGMVVVTIYYSLCYLVYK